MEIKPVKDINNPKYPLKEEMSEKTLKEAVPKRWTESKAVKAALGTLAVVTLAGCYAGVPVPPSITSEGSILTNTMEVTCGKTAGAQGPSQTQTVNYMPVGTVAPATLNVAPLFTHGDGRGSAGCVMVAPPVFLSEEEALTVINEIALEYGLNFSSADTPEFSNVRRPITNLSPDFDENSPKPSKQGEIISFKTDFADPQHGIAIEFVSVEDVKKWSSGPSGASVEDYDTKDTADQLSESLEDAYGSSKTVAVLYDPCELYIPEKSSNEENRSKTGVKSREMSETDLKAQARDFFDWLKSQGII